MPMRNINNDAGNIFSGFECIYYSPLDVAAVNIGKEVVM